MGLGQCEVVAWVEVTWNRHLDRVLAYGLGVENSSTQVLESYLRVHWSLAPKCQIDEPCDLGQELKALRKGG